MKPPPDWKAREAALDVENSCAVAAPAGSGKTGLLTQRVMRLLPLCEQPEQLLCITFTRKAAAEMKQRIQAALHAARSDPRPNDPHSGKTWDLASAVLDTDNQRGWNLLRSPDRLRIQTIDGLCRSLTLMHPLSSSLGGNAGILDQPDSAYRRAADLTLDMLESDQPLSDDIARLLVHFDNDRNRAIDLLVQLLAEREQWLEPLLSSRTQGARGYFEEVVAELVAETLDELRDLLMLYQAELCSLADYAGSCCLEHRPESILCGLAGCAELPGTLPGHLASWQPIVELLLTSEDDWRKPRGLNIRNGFPPGQTQQEKAVAKQRKGAMAELLITLSQVPGLLDLLVRVRILPPPEFAEDQWQLLDSLTRILPHCVTRLKLVFRQLNSTDYSEITQGALEALGDEDDPSELALALDYRIQHILVDEFQDTSSSQWRLLEKLTAGWQAGDGRTLFIVGDGMQSCYGFRNANVGLFLDARRAGLGQLPLQPLDLCVNFRSRAGIVNWVNQAFSAAFPAREDISSGAVTYSPSVAHHTQSHDNPVVCHLFTDAVDGSQEAAQIVNIVQQELRDNPGDRIAILVRDRSRLRYIVPALQASAIEFRAIDIDPLARRTVIQDLLTLTQALCDCSDHNAWLALLRTPWVGLSNSDLLKLVAAGRAAHPGTESGSPLLVVLQQHRLIPDLAEDARRILDRVAPLLSGSWQQRRRKSLRTFVEGLWTSLGGPASLLELSDLENAAQYFRLLDAFDQGGRITRWSEFRDAVAKLYAAPAASADCRVEVMTIHRAKGLEFETVIIPGLHQSPGSEQSRLLNWQERINRGHEKRLLISPLAATGAERDPLYSFLYNESRRKNRLESSRLFYVGCTRAIRKLHLLGKVNTDDRSGEDKPPSPGSMLADIWPLVNNCDTWTVLRHTNTAAAVEPSAEDRQFPGDVPTAGPLWMRRLPPDWQPPSLADGGQLVADAEHPQSGEQALREYDFSNRSQRHIGTILHRSLAQVVREGLPNWNADRIERQLPSWRMQLRQLGLSGENLDRACRTIADALELTLTDPTGRWILDAEHPHSAVEVAYWQHTSGYSQSVLDRTFLSNGERWIIDYKSSTPGSEQSLESFLHTQQHQYREQMLRYRDLFSGETVRLALYFPLLGQFQELDTQP